MFETQTYKRFAQAAVTIAAALTANAANASWVTEQLNSVVVSYSGFTTFDGAASDGLAHTISFPNRVSSGGDRISVGGISGPSSHIELSGTFSMQLMLDPFVQGNPQDIAQVWFVGSAGLNIAEGGPPTIVSQSEGRETFYQTNWHFDLTWDSLPYEDGQFILAQALDHSSYLFVNNPPVPEPSVYALMLAGLGVVGLAARRRNARAKTSKAD